MNDEQHDNEGAQLQAWGNTQLDPVRETAQAVLLKRKDARIAELEARVAALESALKPFASATGDEDVQRLDDRGRLYIYDGTYLNVYCVGHEKLRIAHLRDAYAVMHGKPTPTADSTANESEGNDE
jgi:hypothetical protein